ncbi:MAG TPA: subclass B3 metallo-beta-lactamase [Gemmatimonadales bacterium]|nr:subclass B3 metallo-beta-lactamase [Gemmatimonadales bacterium]
MRTFMAAMLASSLIARSAPARTSPAGQAATASDSTCVNDPSWTAPQKPVRIHGNTWHVGPRGLGVFLITAPTGHVLIDGGVPGNVPLIEANIRSLGIDLRDIKWILNTQAHCDHAGGIAQLVRETGAEVIAGVRDAELLARGGRDDPQYGDAFTFAPVRVTRTVSDGERLQLGSLSLTAHATPGHTPGNTTWAWTSCEGARCVQVVNVGSLSAPDYRLVDNPKYPGIVADYEASFRMVAALRCDLALAPHPGMVDFWERVAQRERGDAQALIDSTRCRGYADAARRGFEEELARQRRAASLGAQQRPDSVMLLAPAAMTGWREGGTRGVSGIDLYGDFDQPGPYVARTRFADGRGIGPHHHTNTTTITVLEGRFHLGIGTAVDSSAVRAYPPGSFLVIPAGVAHYEWGEGETVIQLSGTGPLGYAKSTPAR